MVAAMSKLFFITPGDFPLDAFDTFGTNVKPSTDNPIGHFGTGLKYAVAIILRLGGSITLKTGNMEYGFYLEEKDFRGKTFQRVRLRSRKLFPLTKWRSRRLPFTTELGKDWEPWQAFRELATNTLDENGWYGAMGLSGDALGADRSMLEVDCGPLFEAFKTNAAFLDMPARPTVWSNPLVEIRRGESAYLYYRGIRVYDLRYVSRFTYNFLSGVELSEDRTAKNIWMLLYRLREIIQEKIEDEGLLRELLRKRDYQTLEGEELSFDYEGGKPTAFHRAALSIAPGGLSRSAGRYYEVARAWNAKKEGFPMTFEPHQWELIEEVLRADDRALAPGAPLWEGAQIADRIARARTMNAKDEVPF